MSHVSAGKVPIWDLGAAEAAAQEMGGVLHKGQQTMRWFGRFVDDSQAWRTMFTPVEAARIAGLPKHERVPIIEAQMSKCDHAISFPGARYDVGLVKQPDGSFRMVWDYWGGGGLDPFVGRDGGKFLQAYGVHAATSLAKKHNGVVHSVKKNVDGTISMKVLVR